MIAPTLRGPVRTRLSARTSDPVRPDRVAQMSSVSSQLVDTFVVANASANVASGRTIVVATLVALGGTGVAHAGFLASPIQLDYVARDGEASDTFATGNALVTAGEVEFPAFVPEGPTFDVDVEDLTIRIDHFFQETVGSDVFGDVPFLGLVFSVVSGSVPAIESVAVLEGEGAMQGLVVTHTDDAIELNWARLSFSPATQIDLRVTFAAPVETEVPVPEPATGGAVAGVIGLATLAAGRRRSTTRAA